MTVDRKLIERVRAFVVEHEYCTCYINDPVYYVCRECGGVGEHDDCEWQSLMQALDALLDDKVPY